MSCPAVTSYGSFSLADKFLNREHLLVAASPISWKSGEALHSFHTHLAIVSTNTNGMPAGVESLTLTLFIFKSQFPSIASVHLSWRGISVPPKQAFQKNRKTSPFFHSCWGYSYITITPFLSHTSCLSYNHRFRFSTQWLRGNRIQIACSILFLQLL
jgi:hypothetical protein